MRIFTFVVLFLLGLQLSAAKERNLLMNHISKEEFAKVLAEGTSWIPFPAYSDRAAWEKISPEVRAEVLKKGEEALKFDWPTVKASYYMDYVRTGNRQAQEQPQVQRQEAVQYLALSELIEGKGRFIDALADGVWALCEQSTWVQAAHLHRQKAGVGLPDPDEPIIDLAVGRIGAILSWVHYYFAAEFDRISPFIAEKLRRTIYEKVLNPYYSRDFYWMGFGGGMVNNWNVWCNFNAMQCILLMEKDHQKRVDAVYKAMRSIDKFINYYPDDGGCDEGPGYWSNAGGKLFEGLELLHLVTGGRVNIFQEEIIKNIGRYIYRAYISDPYTVNFADAGPRGGGGNPALVYRYGKAIGDPIMQGFGAFYYQKRNMASEAPSGGTLDNLIRNLFEANEIATAKTAEPLFAYNWLPDLQFATARDKENDRKGFFFAAKGGNNDESHNHNDVGTFILYYNGLPALIDVGVGTYTGQTFSTDRYSIWTMQSGYHNLPVINGTDQKFGRRYAARDVSFKSSAGTAVFSVEIAGAYPPEAAVKSWQRSYRLNRGKNFIISDKYTLSEIKSGTALHFMTSCKTTIPKAGVIRLEGTGFTLDMLYDASKLTATTEIINLDDRRLAGSWGNSLTRIKLSFNNPKSTGINSIEIRPIL